MTRDSARDGRRGRDLIGQARQYGSTHRARVTAQAVAAALGELAVPDTADNRLRVRTGLYLAAGDRRHAGGAGGGAVP
jgi:hypothetical protein